MNTTEPTLVLERKMKAPAKRIYEAFLDPELLKQYYPNPGTEAIYHAFNATVGGEGHYEFRSPNHPPMAFRIKFLELEPYTRIRHTYVMDMPGMDDEMELLITLEEEDDGTLVRMQQWGLPKPVPLEGAKLGWTGMIDRLQAFVEA